MKFNPIVKKEIAVSSRSYRLMALITVLDSVLFAVVLVALFGRLTGMRLDRSFDQRSTLLIYALLVLVILLLVLTVFPAFTIGSITSERDSGTLDLMLASSLTPFRIASGKLISQLLPALVLLASFLPAMIMPLVFGGVDLQLILGSLLLFVPLTVLLLCIGLFASAVSNSAAGSVLTGYGIVFGMTVLPYFMAFLIHTLRPGESFGTALLYFSPLTQFTASVMKQLGETKLLEQGAALFGVTGSNFFSSLKIRCVLWQSLSALFFFFLAVLNVTPGRGLQIGRKYGKKRVTIQNGP